MRAQLRPNFRLLLGLGLVATLAGSAIAADLVPSERPAKTEAFQPPLPPLPKSPVESFRQLLAMKPAEREVALTNRPPEIRKKILEKVQQYLSLKPDERELRLRTTEVDWYFSHLRQDPPASRQLQSIPEADRQMVESRLAIWDRLSPAQQQDVLKYVPLLNRDPRPETTAANAADQKARENFTRKLDDWKKLPLDQRRDIYLRFQEFFALNSDEQEKTLHLLSEPERAQMEKALARFEQLPAQRRQRILATWPRLEALSDSEREEFVRDADRWQAMTPAERQTLRALFTRLPAPVPPTPPEFPPIPPKPTGAGARNPRQSFAGTNGDLPQ